MGQITPNIGLYIPSAGETGYDDAFAQGMVNLDQHDHTGGPNKGLPITTTGLANFSVTYNKLANDVADVLTGIGTDSSPGNQNRLQILGILRNLFDLSTSLTQVGFVTMNGSVVTPRTFQNTSSVKWTNGNGLAGNPSAVVDTTSFFPVTVPNGGTGLTSVVPYALIAGGLTSTGNFQQVSGLGTAAQYLGSNGPGALPSWQTIPVVTQNVQIATASFNATQWVSMDDSPVSTLQILPAPGAGNVIVPYLVYGKLIYAGSDAFHGGSSVRLYYGNTSNEVGFMFQSGSFKDSYTGYYYAANTVNSSTSAVSSSTWENKSLNLGVNSSSFSGGAACTVKIFVAYSIMNI